MTTDKKTIEVKKAEEPRKKSSIEEDDEFEDFPLENKEKIGWDAVEAAERELNAWEDVWEDDDEADDFAVLLQAEKKKKASGAAPMKL
ncbi:hypothetical protein BC830DRAFT_1224402 [Chytriomyces sp. MP71]|nr:hypothetical protein BC830DRAFT_1224402 [Chytriomyces sp. MP71]